MDVRVRGKFSYSGYCWQSLVDLPCLFRRNQRMLYVRFQWVCHFDRTTPRWNGRSCSFADYSVAAFRSEPRPRQWSNRDNCAKRERETNWSEADSESKHSTYQLGSTSIAGQDARNGSSLRLPKVEGTPRDCINGSMHKQASISLSGEDDMFKK